MRDTVYFTLPLPETQTCYPLVGIVYNPMLLPFLSGSTVFLTNENSLQNCSLNHSPIGCPLMASASLDLSFGSFTTWKPALSVVNFRLCGWSVLARYSRTCFSGAFSATSCWPCAGATAALNLSWTSRFTAREGRSMARNKVLRPGSARGATTASVTETARPKNARKSISYPSLSA